MGELIRREAASTPLPFSGERLTAALAGQVEIEHYHRYLLAREYCRGMDVLDVASGEGYGTALLSQVAKSVIGVEIDAEVVDAARREFNRDNLRYEQGNACSLPLKDAVVDVVVSFETLEHFAEHEQFFREIRRVLKPGGLLIISTPDRDAYSPFNIPPNPFHVKELTAKEFSYLVTGHFKNHAVAAQRAIIGSVILHSESSAKIHAFEKRSDQLIESSDHFARAPYLLAFASDAELPALPNSVFVYRSDIDTDPKARRDAEKNFAEISERIVLVEKAKADAIRQSLIQKSQCEAASLRLQQLENSTIWRMTAPIRKIGLRFPFLARNFRRVLKLLWWTVTLQIGARLKQRRQYKIALQAGVSTISQPAHKVLKKIQQSPAPRPEDIVIPASVAPVVSFIISTYGQVEVTLFCLKSIMEYQPSCPIEIILIDDAYNGPENVEQLKKVKGITFVRNEKNLGFLLSCNHAASLAKGRYLYFLNNDTELCPESVDALVEVLEARQDVGMVGSKLLYPDGTLQEAGAILWNDASGWNFGRNADASRPEFNYLRQVDYCSGASVMVARAVFEAFGGFNPELAPAYYEDSELALRLHESGLKVLYVPRSVVIHHEGKSHGTDITTGVKAHQVINKGYVLEHWGPTLMRNHFMGPHELMRARDYGRNRKTILIIDHYVPETDRDAGSRSTFGIIESLTQADWIVKFWPYNRSYSPVYTSALEQIGVEVIDHRWPGDFALWLKENGPWLDHILINRPHIAVQVLPQIPVEIKATLSFYGHDLHFERLRRQARYAEPAKAIQILAEADEWEATERQVWRKVDMVIYPSEAEALTVRQMMPRILSRSIVPFSFPVFPARVKPPETRSILFVAGFAHFPNVDAAQFLVHEILPRLESKLGKVHIVLAGSHPTEAVRALAGPNVEVTGHVSDDELAKLYGQHRIAVVPLRFGAGVKGKVVEALSRGLPMVTTCTGAQGIPGLENVVPVSDAIDDIVQSIAALLTDDETWLLQSRAQQEFAQRRFSSAAMQESIVQVLEEADACIHGRIIPEVKH
ncbi:MAG: methyltransferase domain-containing protein [Rhodospirillales bacterium]|nr:methyltransferase domain-containing protein [Rhodospirillales bacterium]